MSFHAQNSMLGRLNGMTAPIPSELAAVGVARLSFSISGELLIIKATLYDRPQKRQITAEYHESEWWRPDNHTQAQRLLDALVARLREKLARP